MSYISKVTSYSEYVEKQTDIIIGANAKKAREKMNLSLADVANQFGATEHMIQMFENGQKKSSNVLSFYIENYGLDVESIDFSEVHNINLMLERIGASIAEGFANYVKTLVSDYIYEQFLIKYMNNRFENYNFALANYVINHKYYIPEKYRRKERKTDEIVDKSNVVDTIFKEIDLNRNAKSDLHIDDANIRSLIFHPIMLNTSNFDLLTSDVCDINYIKPNRDDLLTRGNKLKECLYKNHSWKEITEITGISKALLFKMFKGEKSITEKTMDLFVNNNLISEEESYYFTQTEPQYIITKYHKLCDNLANKMLGKLFIEHDCLKSIGKEITITVSDEKINELNDVKLIDKVSDELVNCSFGSLIAYEGAQDYLIKVRTSLVNKLFNI